MQVPIYEQLKGSSFSITDVQANTVSYYVSNCGYDGHSDKHPLHYWKDPDYVCYSPLLFVHDLNKDVYYFGPFIKNAKRTKVINQILGYKLTENLFYKMVNEKKIIILNKNFNVITRQEIILLNGNKLTYSQLLNNIPN
jgi:hypothetical protein